MIWFSACWFGRRYNNEGVVWAAGAGERSGVLPSIHGVGVALLAFSPDGHWLASMGHEAQHTLAVYT